MRQVLPLVRSLTLFMILVWGLVTPVAWLVAGTSGVAGSSLSAGVTLLLGLLTILLFRFLGESNRVAAVMAGTNLRLFGTLGVALLINSQFPAWGLKEFYVWLLVDYLAGLAWETWILNSGASFDFSWLMRPHSK